jgi:hypothetical protein
MPSVGWCPTINTGSRESGQCGRGERRGNRRARRQLRYRAEFTLQRERGLLRAVGRRNQNAARIRQMPLKPLRHALGLLDALRRQPAPEVGLARLGLAVAPENQVHRE